MRPAPRAPPVKPTASRRSASVPGSMAGSGVLVVDKPRGPTSHDVVRTLRKALGTRAVGHCGTLDPHGHRGARRGGRRGHQARALAHRGPQGVRGDPGALRRDRPVRRRGPGGAKRGAGPRAARRPRRLLAVRAGRRRRPRLRRRSGRAPGQVPPAYSAVRKDGERAMDRRAARRDGRPRGAGRTPAPHRSPRVPRRPAVDGHRGRDHQGLLRAGPCPRPRRRPGHLRPPLTALRRTRSGAFGLDEAVSLDAPAAELASRILPLPLAAARALPVAHLTEAGEREARHGRVVPPGRWTCNPRETPRGSLRTVSSSPSAASTARTGAS